MGRAFSSRAVVVMVVVAIVFAGTAYGNSPTECLSAFTTGIQNHSWGFEGAVDAYGRPVTNVSASDAPVVVQGYSYQNCTRFCHNDPETFDWSTFSQQFSAWLLPWLALVSQLPFGAKNRLDNLVSVILAIGSPALAAYSLALTILNRRWLAKRFAGISYPNALHAFRILNSLQHAPLAISNEGALLTSLVVLPQNDDWWAELLEWLNYTHTWSISAATSIAWVVIAYLFTVIDSFTGLNAIVEAGGSDGQATGSIWLWLLAVVIGWLQASPKCDDGRLRCSISRANSIAYVAVDDGPPVLAKQVSDARALTLFDASDVEDAAEDDQMCSAPIYNYARFFSWTLCVEEINAIFRAASRRAAAHISADGSKEWLLADRHFHVNPRNRIASRGAIDAYCTPPPCVRRSHWGHAVIPRFLLASFLALGLQWGTTGAALIMLMYTPTTGLGCRSASYLLYAVVSTIVWGMLVPSSFLVHYSASLYPAKDPLLWKHTRITAVVLRRVAKLLATFNALWIITTSLLQFSNFFNRCYCDARILDIMKGAFAEAYDVISISTVQVSLKVPWAGGLVLGCGCAVIFVGFVNLFLDPTP